VALIVGGLAPAAGRAAALPDRLGDLPLTSVLTELVSNNAVAVVMTPIAIGLGQALGSTRGPWWWR
jgi:di/tricarboxylate transporter